MSDGRVTTQKSGDENNNNNKQEEEATRRDRPGGDSNELNTERISSEVWSVTLATVEKDGRQEKERRSRTKRVG